MWFAKKLRDPSCVILVAEEDGVPLGEVRLDRLDLGVAEVHIAIAPEARGRGVARAALGLAVSGAHELLGATQLRAQVKPSNEPSLKLFRAAGFQEVSEDPDVIEFKRSIDAC
jgi:RimJ/RimL family protein N-acetyltransferase